MSRPLTDKEHELLVRLANGAEIKAYAFELGLNPRTIAYRLASICGKLEANSTANAVHIAWQKGILG